MTRRQESKSAANIVYNTYHEWAFVLFQFSQDFLTKQTHRRLTPSLFDPASSVRSLKESEMPSMHWQQAPGSGVSIRRGDNGDDDVAQRMQAFTIVGGEPIPTHSSWGKHNGYVPPHLRNAHHKLLQAKTRDSRLEASRGSRRLWTPPGDQDVGAHPSHDVVDDNSLDSSPTVSSVSHSEAKSPGTIATFNSSAAKVADLCRAPTADFLMHYHDTSAFIGAKGVRIKKLRFLSGAKLITVYTDRTFEMNGLHLVLVRVKGHPDAVHKAVQITEGTHEIFPPPPKGSPTKPTKSRAPPSSIRSAPSQSPSPTRRPPASDGPPTPLGPSRPGGQQVAGRKPSPAAKEATYATILSRSNPLKKEEVPVSPTVFSETEASAAESESSDRWSECNVGGLEEFCRLQAACIKGPPDDFATWLRSQDVESLQDLLEAVDDDDFRGEMQMNGLKGFKKGTFKKAVQSAVDSQSRSASEDH